MRINKFIALATGKSRRNIDALINNGAVQVNGVIAQIGQNITDQDTVELNGAVVKLKQTLSIILNKPTGYVCSRDGQGSKTIYDLLPEKYHHLKPVGRLDKDSSGLILMTNDGDLAHRLTHPSFKKEKTYIVKLNPQLKNTDKTKIENGIMLSDGKSRLKLQKIGENWQVKMHEGRNRQIRRTFSALGYEVLGLHRVSFGQYKLDALQTGKFMAL
jgi:23S rRNA pseudouridine2605 synthase